uniref:Creatinase N-terminal domain-containing protein n=4 Tax=Chrysemys picta bellii TaxID=8478 RepID=A0A8C3HD55_CHRPI
MPSSRWTTWAWMLLLSGCAMGWPKQSSSATSDIRNCTTSPPFLPPTVTDTSAQLNALRQRMQFYNISAYIVPATDAHMSEYIAERDARLAWISGFTGSAGTGVVTTKKAALWTDSRYWTQAERQMDCNWELQKIVWTDSIGEWLLQEIPAGENIGLDPFLFSIDLWNSYAHVLQGSSRTLVPIEDNLVDLVWGTQRPPSPTSKIYLLPETFTG